MSILFCNMLFISQWLSGHITRLISPRVWEAQSSPLIGREDDILVFWLVTGLNTRFSLVTLWLDYSPSLYNLVIRDNSRRSRYLKTGKYLNPTDLFSKKPSCIISSPLVVSLCIFIRLLIVFEGVSFLVGPTFLFHHFPS